MQFELRKVRVDYKDKNGKDRFFYRFYLVYGNVVIRIKADDYKNHNNEILLKTFATEDK